MRGARPSPSGWKKYVVILLVGSGLLSGCVGSGPSVVLIPAAPGKAEPVQIAEPVKARVLVPLEDGTTTISKNRVELPAGGWYHYFDDDEDE